MKRRLQSGFTLVELISVLVIMGILAAVALPRFFDRDTFDSRGFYDQAQAMMRYAQKMAIAQNRNVYVRLDGKRFAFCFTTFGLDGRCLNKVPAPAGKNSGSAETLAACGSDDWLCEGAPSGMGYGATPALWAFYFNALGKPFNFSDAPPNSNFAGLDISFTGRGTPRHLYVEAETGYVHP